MADIAIPSEQREFRCIHCDGKILIPRDLPPTTGPCPHCAGLITSPARDKPATEIEIPIPIPQVAPPRIPAIPPPPPVASVPVAPSAVPQVPVKAVAPIATVSPPAPAEEKAAHALLEKSDHAELNKPKKQAKPAKAQRSGWIPVMLVLFALILAGGGVAYFAAQELGKTDRPPEIKAAAGDPAISEANYIRIGWQKDAHQLLKNYMAATTSAEKVPFILNGDKLAPKIEDFYGGGVIDDADTPADGFSVYELSEEDRKRGLFMMIYDLPPQFDMKEFFRPLASLEVQYGIDEADLLLSTLARVGNFAMEPLRVHAFFKRTPDGLKLDWEIFAQTKYRTFLNFVELPEAGQTGVFRVFIVEDVPEKGRAVAGTRTYRIVDPANTTDTSRVNVKIDSETGRALSLINWRDTTENRPITKTATLELKWTGEPNAPELSISRFICWEFLGLGGQDTPATASTK